MKLKRGTVALRYLKVSLPGDCNCIKISTHCWKDKVILYSI